jgi:hypothetical protein
MRKVSLGIKNTATNNMVYANKIIDTKPAGLDSSSSGDSGNPTIDYHRHGKNDSSTTKNIRSY